MKRIIVLAAALIVAAPGIAQESSEQRLVVSVDENLWIVFYDLPSRRFRAIRDAFVRRDFDAASRDLIASASYVDIEAGRAIPPIAERMHEVSSQMRSMAENIGDKSITVRDLDPVFARAHWLLAQHYLDLGRKSRDAGDHRNAGRYLFATVHHLERTVIWSNIRISNEILKTLDDLREAAGALQEPAQPNNPYRDKPLVQAEKMLRVIGEEIDRPVALPRQ